MKLSKHIKSILLVTVLFVLFSSCEETAKELTLEQERAVLVASISETPWGASGIVRGTQDAISEFPDFEIEIGDGTYDTKNGKHLWEDSGTWTFADGRSDQIIRDDGVVIDLELTEDQLKLSFEVDENVYSIGGGRTETIISEFFFNLFRRR
jgi:hypothetical protein